VAGASAVIDCQLQLASMLERMLALAREGQFRQLPELDAQCAVLAARLGAMELPDSTDAERESIAGLLQRTAEIDHLAQPPVIGRSVFPVSAGDSRDESAADLRACHGEDGHFVPSCGELAIQEFDDLLDGPAVLAADDANLQI